MPRLSLQIDKSGMTVGHLENRKTWRAKSLMGVACLLAAGSVFAQATPAEDPDWKESEVPPPPAFNATKLIPIEMERLVELRYGVDPASISLTKEGVTRYVIVITSPSGTVSALYEGLRCATGEVSSYGRYNDGHWRVNANPEWRNLYDSPAVRHSLSFARQGACSGTATPNTVAELVRNLKNPRSDLPR